MALKILALDSDGSSPDLADEATRDISGTFTTEAITYNNLQQARAR